jgi:nucleoside-diphosphate-sugar epimerase
MHADSPDAPLRVCVLGAGYVGSAFATAAAHAGHEVWAMRRTAVPIAADGVRWLRADLSTGFAAGVPDGTPLALDGVILTVAPSHGQSYRDTYLPAVRAALVLARATGARSVLYTSSTGVYGGRDGEWVTEQSARRGPGDGNAVLIAAEDELLASGLPGVTILRVAGIYGPGRDPRPRLRVAHALPQRGNYWMNLAHRDDIVGAALHLLRRDTNPSVLNVCDGAPALAADVARWVAQQDGNDPDHLQFVSDAPLQRSNQRVSNAALLETGLRLRYADFRSGFADIR